MTDTSYIKRLKIIFILDVSSTLHESVYKEKQEIFVIACDNVLSIIPNLVFHIAIPHETCSFQRHTSAQCRCITYKPHCLLQAQSLQCMCLPKVEIRLHVSPRNKPLKGGRFKFWLCEVRSYTGEN